MNSRASFEKGNERMTKEQTAVTPGFTVQGVVKMIKQCMFSHTVCGKVDVEGCNFQRIFLDVHMCAMICWKQMSCAFIDF